MHIRIPDHGEPPFPVFYFFDGHNLFRDEDATYGKSWGLDEYCRNWDKQMIIVGVECAHGHNERMSEYLPYGVDYGWLKGIEPLGEATMQGIIYELKPYIDTTFPTIPFRECTAIGGSSMGGLMSLYGVICHNGEFELKEYKPVSAPKSAEEGFARFDSQISDCGRADLWCGRDCGMGSEQGCQVELYGRFPV